MCSGLELQAAFARTFCQCFYTPDILVTTPVECNGLDAFTQGTFSQGFTYQVCFFGLLETLLPARGELGQSWKQTPGCFLPRHRSPEHKSHLELRNTLKRGRAGVPKISWRTRV